MATAVYSLELLEALATGAMGERAVINRATGRVKDKDRRAPRTTRAARKTGGPTGRPARHGPDPLVAMVSRWASIAPATCMSSADDAYEWATLDHALHHPSPALNLLPNEREARYGQRKAIRVKKQMVPREVSQGYLARFAPRPRLRRPRHVERTCWGEVVLGGDGAMLWASAEPGGASGAKLKRRRPRGRAMYVTVRQGDGAEKPDTHPTPLADTRDRGREVRVILRQVGLMRVPRRPAPAGLPLPCPNTLPWFASPARNLRTPPDTLPTGAAAPLPRAWGLSAAPLPLACFAGVLADLQGSIPPAEVSVNPRVLHRSPTFSVDRYWPPVPQVYLRHVTRILPLVQRGEMSPEAAYRILNG